ncbi:MAG: EAL domain-containing protein [Rhizobiales bacterium]|nr:EAL domain-containing protein [Hyphomicrobiales bacterium]
MRLAAVFIAICMVVIAASAGAVVFLGFGFSGTEAITVALAVLTALGLYNAVATQPGVRAVAGNQLSELSRSNFELSRQVTELGRRLAAVETRVDAVRQHARAAVDPLAVEISELGSLVRQLAETVATYEARFGEVAKPIATPAPTPAATAAAAPMASAAPPAPALEPQPTPARKLEAKSEITATDERQLAAIRSAVDANRIDLYLQPIVTLPQRKVRYYEAMSRLRTDSGDMLMAADFIPQARRAGLMAKIDHLVVFRSVQVARRLLMKNRDIGLFCNISDSTLTDGVVFQQLLDFLDANRAIAPSIVLEFTQSALRAAGPIENESLSALADRGFRFSLDNLQDVRIEPRDLATRGFRYVKIPGQLLLNPKDTTTDIHPADLSDLLGRFGIDLIADKIESEAMVVDLLDYDVRFGQGFLFSPPRPVRAEALQGVADRGDVIAREIGVPDEAPPPASTSRSSTNEPAGNGAGGARTTGLAQLVPRFRSS